MRLPDLHFKLHGIALGKAGGRVERLFRSKGGAEAGDDLLLTIFGRACLTKQLSPISTVSTAVFPLALAR